MTKSYFVYILSNPKRNIVYVGVTNSLERRMLEHKSKLNSKSFSAQYNCNALIYFEEYKYVSEAIYREKQIKGWARAKKDALINALNPGLLDLSAGWYN